MQVLDATKAFKKLITDKAQVEGLPPSALGLAAQQASHRSTSQQGATVMFNPSSWTGVTNALWQPQPAVWPCCVSSLRHCCQRIKALYPVLHPLQATKEGHPEATPENGPWLFTLDFPSYFPVGAADTQLMQLPA